MNACIGTLVWFFFGWGFAFGDENDGPVIGRTSYFYIVEADHSMFFFQWAFCVTASTIVSGAVAERIKLEAFFLACVFITGFIYPVVVHWVWDGNGWLSAGNSEASTPIIDFAGSGVVHMTGGWCAFVGAYLTGPRTGRFDENSKIKYGNHSVPFQLFGTMTLWFGWYGFNCGSTLAVAGVMNVAARAAVTSTLSATSGGIATTFLHLAITKKWSIGLCCNGILAGLVSITANCAVVSPGCAIVIGGLGGIFYYGFSNLLVKIKVDDPLDASAVHGCCGFWGVVATGIFADSSAIASAYSEALAAQPVGQRFGNQLLGAIAIFVWTVVISAVMFKSIGMTLGLKTESGSEKGGLDAGEFGMPAYEIGSPNHKSGEGQTNRDESDPLRKSNDGLVL